jgi:hypothetical protein
MAEQNVNPLAVLGRLLTFFGVVWFGIVVLGGIGLLSELGMSGDFLAGVGGSVIPALILITAGRALRRRARATEDRRSPTPVPVPGEATRSEKRVPTSRSQPSPTPVLTPPHLPETTPAPTPPVRSPTPSSPVPRQVDPLPPPSAASVQEPKSPAPEPKKSPSIAAQVGQVKQAGRAKTSKEMVEEAHKKWGRGRTG